MFGLSIPAFLLNNWKAILGGVVVPGLLIAFKIAVAFGIGVVIGKLF